MPRAICFSCGGTKSSALVPCPHCRSCPEADDDLILSLAMSERHLDEAGMKATARCIREGKRPKLDEKKRQQLLAHLEEFKRNPGVKR